MWKVSEQMTDPVLTSAVDETWLEAQITRADGTVEPVKIVAYWNRNPLKRLYFRVKGKRYGI